MNRFLAAALLIPALAASAQTSEGNEAYHKYLADWAALMERWSKVPVELSGDMLTNAEAIRRVNDAGLAVALAPECQEEYAALGHLPIYHGEKGEAFLRVMEGCIGLTAVMDGEGKIWFTKRENAAKHGARGCVEALDLPEIEVEIATDDIPRSEPETYAVVREEAARTKITLRASGLPLDDVLADLSKKAGREVCLDAFDFRLTKLRHQPVVLDVKEKPLWKVLDEICESLQLNWDVVLDDLVLGSPDKMKERRDAPLIEEAQRLARLKAHEEVFAREVTLRGESLSATQLAALLENQLGVPCRTDSFARTFEGRWSFDGEKSTVGKIAEAVMEEGRVSLYYRRGVLWIVKGYMD